MPFTFGVLTVSDTCSSLEKIDLAGVALQDCIKASYPDGIVTATGCIPDDYDTIVKILTHWCDNIKCNIIFTTGGTGFAPRDVTPEATRFVIEKLAPAVTQHITAQSLKVTSHAILSRGICGIRKKSIILNMPGSKKAVVECFGFVAPVLKHAVEVLLDNKEEVNELHEPINWKSQVKIACAALRNRKSPYPMVPIDEALNIIFAQVDKFNENFVHKEDIIIATSLGRVLFQDIYSTTPLPPFPASIKDGYAVIASDGHGVRQVKEVITAGDAPADFKLKSGEIVRISTGAPVPEGADAVVQVEDTDLFVASDDMTKELEVMINISPSVGLDIRPIGFDIPEATKVLDKGDIISPAHIGVMAAIGINEVTVYSRFSVGIISSGNELQEQGLPLEPGRIYDSNKITLINLLKQYNYFATDCGIAKDDPNEIKSMMIRVFAKHDVLITTGGVSMGEYDLIKQVLVQDFDATIAFGRVDMKPGKPTTFATCMFNRRMKLIFALPGNPVSASVTCILFVIPALQRKENRTNHDRRFKVVLDMDVTLDVRPEYMRAEISTSPDGKLIAKPTGNQISSRLNSLVGAHALLILPKKTESCTQLTKGSNVDAMQIGAIW